MELRPLRQRGAEKGEGYMATVSRLFGANRLKGLQDSAIGDEEVARVAYALYEQRGRTDGHHLEDWLEAERRVRQRNRAR